MSNLIEVTEDEVAEMIGIADRENVLPLRFGPGRAWLDLDMATNLFTDHLKKMRKRRTSQHPSTNAGDASS